MPAYRYPDQKHRRKHGPQGYQSVAEYRDWLRDEFAFRCVYCLEREQRGNRLGHFHIDHFAPTAQQPDQRLSYDNLFYSCGSCNLLKGSKTVPDPLRVFTSDTVTVRQNGSLLGRTQEAKRLIDVLQLNDASYRKRRRLMIEILSAVARTKPAVYRELLGFPDDLPNLETLKPPGGNTRPAGIKQSYHALRESGQLPDTY